MSHAREMLEAAPVATQLGADELAAAIDACLDAGQSCTACADASLAEDDVEMMRACIALDLTCADLCFVTARELSRSTHADHVVVHRLLRACVRSCEECAEECERHAQHHRHCAISAAACRTCARACGVLLDAEAFEQLERLAGG